jgi:RHS repeat-associated protein
VSDTLGSTTVALSASGGVAADQLFTPYGATRYASGTMPTSYGFTGQRLDPSGLSYFNARYYDGVVGQFVSADSVQGPNRYAYVSGNPETYIDPTGEMGLRWGLSPEGFRLSRLSRPTKAAAPPMATSYTHFCDGCEKIQPLKCDGLNAEWCWDFKYDEGEFKDGVAEFLFGIAGLAAYIAAIFVTDGAAGFLLSLFSHGAASEITHALVNGWRHIWEGIFGPLSSADKVLYDIFNLVGDFLSFLVGAFDSIQAIRQIGKAGGDFLVKLGNFISHGTNVKSLGAFFGDVINIFSLFPGGVDDWESLREDGRAAYGWKLPSLP